MNNRIKKRHIFLILIVLLFLGLHAGYYADIPVEDLKTIYANNESQFIEIDGMDVHYRDEGAGDIIVLIHGTASSLHTWDKWVEELKGSYRVIRLDMPAFGLTGANANGDYTIKSYTSFLNTFLKELSVESFYLAGNSLGGNIAWNYAVDYPEQIKKLVLINSSGLPTNKAQPWIFKMAKTPIVSSLFLSITPRFVVKKNLEQVYHDDSKVTEALVTRFHDMSLRTGNRQAFIDRARTDFKLGNSVNYARLKNVKSETLIIWGEDDEWISLNNGKQMDSLIPNSNLSIIKNSGHVPMEENPSQSATIMTNFLKS